jgi:hypothetical protein
LCGQEVLTRFRRKLEHSGIPADPDAVLDLLILFRTSNRIDDLLLTILEEDLAVSEILLSTGKETLPGRRQIRHANDSIRSLELSPARWSELFAPFSGRRVSDPGCSFDDFKTLTVLGRKLRSVLVSGVAGGHLEPDTYRLLSVYESEANTDRLFLGDYLTRLLRTKNTESKGGSGASPFPSELLPDGSGLTRRMALYRNYDPIQIRMMTSVLKTCFQRLNANSSELVFNRRDGSRDSVPVSPMGQYFFARRLFLRDLDELARSVFFNGKRPSAEEVLTAALETGLIGPELIDPLLKLDDLYKPEVPKWKRVTDLALRLTGQASVFIPPPYNFVTSIALLLVEGLIEKKLRKPSQGDPGYDPF